METTAARFSAKDMAYIAVFTRPAGGVLLDRHSHALGRGLHPPDPGGVPGGGRSGGKRGTLAVVVYLLLGAIGVPVFSGFQGGTAALLGTTGGYIAGFLFSALAMWMLEKLLGRSLPALALSMVLGLAVCYAFGTAWYMAVYTRSNGAVALGTVLGWCVAPYIIPDLVKIGLAVGLSNRLQKHIR